MGSRRTSWGSADLTVRTTTMPDNKAVSSYRSHLEISMSLKILFNERLNIVLYFIHSVIAFLFIAACEVHFDNTPVPIENVLGEVGGGFKVSMIRSRTHGIF